jgi:hypothetical protein
MSEDRREALTDDVLTEWVKEHYFFFPGGAFLYGGGSLAIEREQASDLVRRAFAAGRDEQREADAKIVAETPQPKQYLRTGDIWKQAQAFYEAAIRGQG